MKEVFASRLKRARKLRKMSQQELASRLDFTKQMVSKYENGELFPDSRRLLQISVALGLPPGYFLRSETVRPEGFLFRKKASLQGKALESLQEQLSILMESYIEIEEIMGEPSPEPLPLLDVRNPGEAEEAAETLRGLWSLGTDAFGSVTQILEGKGIKVIRIEADRGFAGVSCRLDGGHSVIVVNGTHNVERQRFTLLHELGHLVLRFPEGGDEEKACDRFAGAMLLPGAQLLQLLQGKREHILVQELQIIQEQFGMSAESVLYRCKDLGIVSTHRHAMWYKRINTDARLREALRESRYNGKEEPVRFEQMVYSALAEGEISISKASQLLDKPLEHIMDKYILD